MFGSNASAGDWVALKRRVPLSIVDSLTGSGLRRGTHGVVLNRTGSRLRVRFDSGLGAVHATVRSRDTRLVRRRGGIEQFDRRAQAMTAIRVGVLLAFAAPFLYFAGQYVWINHTTSGLIPAVLIGVIQGVLDAVTLAISDPIRSLIYFIVVSLVWRWARRR